MWFIVIYRRKKNTRMPINFISSLCGLCFIIMFGVKKKKNEMETNKFKNKKQKVGGWK